MCQQLFYPSGVELRGRADLGRKKRPGAKRHGGALTRVRGIEFVWMDYGDFLRCDVEGAEVEVFRGAQYFFLKEKRPGNNLRNA